MHLLAKTVLYCLPVELALWFVTWLFVDSIWQALLWSLLIFGPASLLFGPFIYNTLKGNQRRAA